MASYVVAASLFIIGSSYLLNFAMEPPGGSATNLDHLALTAKAETTLQLLLGSPGYPNAWDASASAIDGLGRLGLIEAGSSIRIDPQKFDALARGRYASSSSGNGYVDYAEAKEALGLDGFDFHLRAYPVSPQNAVGAYGVTGLTGFRVGYVGAGGGGGGWNATATTEAASLEALPISFNPWLHAANATGDGFVDNPNALRQWLVPNIGATISQTVLSPGAGTVHDFYRVEPEVYSGELTLELLGEMTTAMALSSNGLDLGYAKNRELRAILGSANFSDVETGQSATLSWKEWVDTGSSYDCGDYGFVEVSADGGATWTPLTSASSNPSGECGGPNLAQWDTRVLVVNGANCGDCLDKDSVLVAFHWVADNDNALGEGWIVDDVSVTEGSATLFSKTFASPQYDMVIVGSEVDHNAFVAEEVKDAIRDYVDTYGGRIMVLGGQENVQWLDRLFDAGVGGASGGLSAPDTTHPLLTLPNALGYTAYSNSGTWDFSSSDDSDLFNMIVGTDDSHHVLSVSGQGAFGDDPDAEGSVMLTTYLPYKMSSTEASKFLANSVVYGRYHYLYAEVGPPIPDNEAVASVARAATMNKMRTGDAEYVEMSFLLYMWPGASTSTTYAAVSVTPSPPTVTSVTAADTTATVTWTAPTSLGTGTPSYYHVYRGNAPGYLTTLRANLSAATLTFQDTGLTNGQTYYYNVRLITTAGNGTVSNTLSATPLGLPGAPTGLAATDGTTPGYIDVSWSAPASTGGGTVLGYAIWANVTGDPSTFSQLAETGSAATYRHYVSHTDTMTYKVAALTGAGWGPNSTTDTGRALTPALAPQTFDASTGASPGSITLTWVAPTSFGSGTHSGYKIFRSEDDSVWTTLASGLSTANISFTDATLGTGVTRYYRVAAETTVGDGLNSTTRDATTMDVAGAPTGFNATTGVTAGSILLTWAAPTQLNGGTLLGYTLWRSTDGATWTNLSGNGLDAANVTWNDAGLGASATWKYRLQARTNVGDGTNSSDETATTLPPAGAPTGFAVSNLTAGTLRLTWAVPTQLNGGTVSSYKLWRSADGNTWTLLASPSNVDVAYDDSSLGANASWRYRIQAVTQVGDGTNSSDVTEKTKGVPYPPTSVSATVVLTTTTVTWVAPWSESAVTSYEVWRSDTQDGTYTLQATVYVTSHVEPGTGKWFKIKAVSAAGTGNFSAADQA